MPAPPLFNYPEAILCWIALAWVFLPEVLLVLRAGESASNPQDAGTLRLIDRFSDLAMLLALILSFVPWLLIPIPRLALNLGTALVVVAGLLRRACFRALGQYFTAAVVVRPGQPVVQSGPYRLVRHPGYTAAFLLYLGLGLALGSWLSLALVFFTACYVYSRRVRAEEQALLATLGKPYRLYMQRTWRFVPFLF